jgi:F-box-like
MHISGIPAEIIEHILLYTAMAGDPRSIASFAQTCRFFRNLVYEPVDRHLWREVFLLQFDDPRLPQAESCCNFDWGDEFRRRFKVTELFHSYATEMPVREVIDALSCAISTSLPLNARGSLSSASTNFLGDRLPQSPYPIFPPTDGFDFLVPSMLSKNVIWLNKVLAHGYPADIATECILGGTGKLCNDERSRFFKLLCHTGLSVYSSCGGHRKVADSDIQATLRHWARKKVYNLGYLMRDRQWGPYMFVNCGTSIPMHQSIDEAHMETEHVNLFALQDNAFGSNEMQRVPLAKQLHVDWEYLFCVRMVMENNLRDTVGCKADELLRGLLGFDCLRSHSESQTRLSHTEEGWDWAGIEGVWRRCICWMDYRDLMSKYRNARNLVLSTDGLFLQSVMCGHVTLKVAISC